MHAPLSKRAGGLRFHCNYEALAARKKFIFWPRPGKPGKPVTAAGP